MNARDTTTVKRLFIVAAIFNFSVAVMLGGFQSIFLPILGMEPLDNTAFLHLFMALVFVYGLGYYWVACNPETNRDIIRMGIIGKLLVVVILLVHAFWGNVSWGFAAVGSADLVFAILFIRFL